jgi:short subunit dehydrogenase-like uncharacterized protein
MSKILILGAYGNFGERISRALAKKNIPLILGGRDEKKLDNLSKELTVTSTSPITTIKVDINKNILQALAQTKPKVVINTCGPLAIEGAHPCMGLVGYDEYLAELAEHHVNTRIEFTR